MLYLMCPNIKVYCGVLKSEQGYYCNHQVRLSQADKEISCRSFNWFILISTRYVFYALLTLCLPAQLVIYNNFVYCSEGQSLYAADYEERDFC